jgi:nicotinamide riboside kinase
VNPPTDSVRLIAILGAESTGKTTLAAELAAHFHTEFVPEFLREFCDLHRRPPTQSEQRSIMATQLEREQSAVARATAAGATVVFCDTAPLQTAVYSEIVFGDTSLYAIATESHRRYRHTLLLLPDIGWQADGPQRDGPQVQQPVTALLRSALTCAVMRFSEIGGAGSDRFLASLRAISQAH